MAANLKWTILQLSKNKTKEEKLTGLNLVSYNSIETLKRSEKEMISYLQHIDLYIIRSHVCQECNEKVVKPKQCDMWPFTVILELYICT